MEKIREMNRKEKIIDETFRWSFSKLETFETSPRQFYLQYMLDPPIEQDQNAFAEYGTFCHCLLESWAKGEVEKSQLADLYAENYCDHVLHLFPPYPKGFAEKAYREGLLYFQNFCGFGKDMRVLSVEEKFELDIAGNLFVGIADLVLEDNNTGDITIIDHKTKSERSMKNDLQKYRRQLYTYAAYCKQKFGRFPKVLKFNMIKSMNFIAEEFNLQSYEETMRWIANTIDLIQMETDWKENESRYFCQNICGVWADCDSGIRLNTAGG